MGVFKILMLGGAVAAATVLGPAIAEQAQTTRIVTEPQYGAIVTVEHGVNVYRPVPPTQHLIVNPQGKTPLVLSIDGPHGAARR